MRVLLIFLFCLFPLSFFSNVAFGVEMDDDDRDIITSSVNVDTNTPSIDWNKKENIPMYVESPTALGSMKNFDGRDIMSQKIREVIEANLKSKGYYIVADKEHSRFVVSSEFNTKFLLLSINNAAFLGIGITAPESSALYNSKLELSTIEKKTKKLTEKVIRKFTRSMEAWNKEGGVFVVVDGTGVLNKTIDCLYKAISSNGNIIISTITAANKERGIEAQFNYGLRYKGSQNDLYKALAGMSSCVGDTVFKIQQPGVLMLM